jgi:hypothetical protein
MIYIYDFDAQTTIHNNTIRSQNLVSWDHPKKPARLSKVLPVLLRPAERRIVSGTVEAKKRGEKPYEK